MAKDFFEKVFLWPLFGGITTFFGVIAGYLGAHYDEEIASAVTPWFFENRSFAAGPSLFWVMVSAFGACFTGTLWAQARSSKRLSDKMMEATESIDSKTNSLADRAKELDERVRRLHTLPPVGFLETYREIVISSEAAYEDARSETLSFEVLAFVIRTQLLWVLKLTQAFDADGEQAKYGVNVMFFRESSSLSPTELHALDTRIRFIEKGVAVNKLAGVLDMVCEFSVSTESGVKPDSTLSPFALPIPVLDEEERQARAENGVLPGAPDAFTSRSESVIETPDDWTNRANTNHFSQPLRKELSEFFQETSMWMQSFVSIPLYQPDCPDNTEKNPPIAVLNVHRDLPNKLAAEKYELLSPLLVPVTLIIERLLWNHRDSLKNIEGNTK